MGKGKKPQQGKRGNKHKKPSKEMKKHKPEHPSGKAPSEKGNPKQHESNSTKVSSKIKQKLASKKKPQLQLDPKLKNKNHQQKAKNWKDASKTPKTSEEEQRVIIRKTYNSLMENAKDKTKAQEYAEKCLTLMGDEISKYGFKRDGSRIIQACLTHGSEALINKVKKACKGEYYKLMQDKYGRFLARKLYDDAFDDMEKKAVLEHVCGNMEKYMVHMYATDLIEHIYSKGKAPVKEKIFEATFGAKLKFIKATEETPSTDINKIFSDHPLIRDQIMAKLGQQIDTFVLKGLIRLTFIQKLVLFYVRHATQEGIEKMLEEAHKNYLALLGSRDGLYAACILFTAANQKLRKHMVKQLRTENENLVDNMLTNHLGTVFLLKVLFTMDDTKLSCKIVIDRALELLPELLETQPAMRMLSGISADNIKKYYANDDCEILNYAKYSTSKKDDEVRKAEVVEHLVEGLSKTFPACIPGNLGNRGVCELLTEALSYVVKGHYEGYKELVDVFLSELESQKSYEQSVVDIIKRVVEEEAKGGKGQEFGTRVCELVKKNLEIFLESKGVFAICKLLNVEGLRNQLHSKIMENKDKIQKLTKTSAHNKGLEVILNYINEHKQ